MEHIKISFDNPVKVGMVNKGAAFVVGDNIVTNQSLNKTNLAAIRVGDGKFMNHTERVIHFDKDDADLFVVSLNNYIQGLF